MIMFTNFLVDNPVSFVAVLQLLLSAVLAGLILADLGDHLVASLTEHLPVSLLAHLPGHRLTLLAVDEVLQFLRLGLLLRNAPLNWLADTLLVRNREGLEISQLLADLFNAGTALLLVHSSWDVLAVLSRPLLALLLMSLDADGLLAVQLHGEAALPVLDNLLLFPAITSLNLNTIVNNSMIHINLVDYITDLLMLSEASLHKESLRNNLNIHVLHKITVDILDSETFLIRHHFDDSCTVRSDNVLTLLNHLSEASFLHVRLADVLMDNFLDLLTLRGVVKSIGLRNVASKHNGKKE